MGSLRPRLLSHETKLTCYSREVNPQINRIYQKLTEIFKKPSPTTAEIDCALESMKLIVPLSEDSVAKKSYELFRVVMKAPVSSTYSQEKKWEASRLAMHGAYKSNKSFPRVKDPHDILTFLSHHFNLAPGSDRNQDEPIQNALRALAYALEPVAVDALKSFDPTEPSFIRGICSAFKDNKPPQLRTAALSFLPLIGDKWFTADPIMESDQMKSLCVDWASAVDSIEHTRLRKAILEVFFGMVNSSHWRPHIVAEKWKLLDHFTWVPDSQQLKKCIDNPDLIDAIRSVENTGTAGALWLKILWLKYKELIPQVQKQLYAVTKEVSQGRRRSDLDAYLAAIGSELNTVETALTQYDSWSTDPTAVVLRRKIDNFQETKVALLALKRG